MTDLPERYRLALHGMQSGVMMKRQREIEAGVAEDQRETGPKHLRVGVNSAMADHSALAKLLIDAGYITLDDYVAAVADAMEAERDRYQVELSVEFGANVTLG